MLRDKPIVISGAGGTIAGSVESALSKQGAQLVLVNREGVRIQGRATPYDIPPIEVDFGTLDQAIKIVAQVEAELGRIDGLVHLTGDVTTGKALSLDERDFDTACGSNIKTLFNTVTAVLPSSLKRDEAFIGGIACQGAWEGCAADAGLFAAAKSAVATYLRPLDAELAETAVEVSVVFSLGPVDTPTNRARLRTADHTTLIHPYTIGQAFVSAATSGIGCQTFGDSCCPPTP